jgi:hypothetical protein
MMKITIIKNATKTSKPQNFCPWMAEDLADKKN